jgi:CRP-like cAMP-binding protein
MSMTHSGAQRDLANAGNGKLNRILRRLTPADFASLQSDLEIVSLSFKEVLYEQGQPIEHMHFVESGVVSIVTDLDDGGTVETGTIGREGVVGIPAFLGTSSSVSRAFCQIPGHAGRVPIARMLAERNRNTRLAELVLRSANAMMMMLAQTAACNRAHPVEERMCRWLLMTHDRVDGDEFPLTQEFLAQMLGVRRPSVNTAGLALQNAGLIRYSRGKIAILNRQGLESSSCECYAVIAREFERALGARER